VREYDVAEYGARVRQELDLRLLRAFVAVAEELHFTRAAQRLFVAQQALSRDIRRLESQVGARLFVRSTRNVSLTIDGERLLTHARGLLALNDAALRDLSGATRPLLVDVIGQGLTAARIVEAARQAAPQVEFTVRYGGGLGAALPHLLAGRLDVAFGRPEGLPLPFTRELSRRLVRYEPLALTVPDSHPLARLDRVPLARLRGLEIDTSAGNEDAPEWVDLGAALLDAFGARPLAAHPHVVGPDETARHLRSHQRPILTMSESPTVRGAVLRPLVDPVPVYPWAIVHRREARHPGLAALDAAAAELGAKHGWAALPDDAWLSSVDGQWTGER
jgi:DNA-binding transcriptional LysR family regulator